jgi:hypothetical protein
MLRTKQQFEHMGPQKLSLDILEVQPSSKMINLTSKDQNGYGCLRNPDEDATRQIEQQRRPSLSTTV